MTESLHNWLKTILEISVLRLLFWSLKRVTVTGQSQVWHNLLQRKEINLWDWYYTTFSLSLNLNLPSWILVVAQNNLFMISLERGASIAFSVHLLSYFTWLRKKLYSSQWMFNKLTKLTKILNLDEKKNSMQDVLFHSEHGQY